MFKFAVRRRALAVASAHPPLRLQSTNATTDKVKVLVVGGGMSPCRTNETGSNLALGTGGLTVANQIYDRFKADGKTLNAGDITILDAAEYHYYQVGDQTIS
jgi:hypothetical protein